MLLGLLDFGNSCDFSLEKAYCCATRTALVSTPTGTEALTKMQHQKYNTSSEYCIHATTLAYYTYRTFEFPLSPMRNIRPVITATSPLTPQSAPAHLTSQFRLQQSASLRCASSQSMPIHRLQICCRSS